MGLLQLLQLLMRRLLRKHLLVCEQLQLPALLRLPSADPRLAPAHDIRERVGYPSEYASAHLTHDGGHG